MTEDQLLAGVTVLCDRLGLLWHHCSDSRRCEGKRGLPDLIIVGRRVIFAELKSESGDTSPDQDFWYWALDRAGQMWLMWRPADLESGQIEDMLKALV